MVGGDGVYHRLALPVLFGHVHANLHVGALHLVVQCLADVVEQASPLGHRGVKPQLAGHQAGQKGHFLRVVQHVLAVAGAVAQPAQQLHQLVVDAVDAHLQHGALALLLDGGLHLPAGLLHGLLDAGGVDAPVGDKLLQCDAGHLPAYRLKAGQCDGLGGVVDDQVHPGQSLNGPDVPALTADDPALHLIVGQGHHADGRLAHMVRGAPLDGQGDDLPGGLVRLLLGLLLELPDLHGLFVDQLALQVVQQVLLGLLHREGGDLLQHLKLAFFHLLGFPQALLRLFVLLLDLLFLALGVLPLLLQALLLLEDAPLLMLDLLAPVGQLFFRLVPQAVDLILAFQNDLLLLRLGGLYSVADDALGFLLGRTDGGLRLVLPVGKAQHKSHRAGHSRR